MTFSLDFRPRKDGLPYDPQSYGGSVDLVRVYPTPERTGVPLQTAGPAVRVEAGLYRFTLEDLPDGTYYTLITWTQAAGATPYTDANDRFTLPVPDPILARLRRLVAEPTDVTYTDNDLARYVDENTDAQGRVDIFGAAADIWEEKAAAMVAAAGTAPTPTTVKTGDQTVSYSDGGSPAEHAFGQARFFRAKSVIKSRRVVSPGGRRRGRPEQMDAGWGHAYPSEV